MLKNLSKEIELITFQIKQYQKRYDEADYRHEEALKDKDNTKIQLDKELDDKITMQ